VIASLRPSALSYQIAFITPNEIDMTCDDLFVCCLFVRTAARFGGDRPRPRGQKSSALSGAEVPRKFCGELMHMGPSLLARSCAAGPSAAQAWAFSKNPFDRCARPTEFPEPPRSQVCQAGEGAAHRDHSGTQASATTAGGRLGRNVR
jgi:hypothetical protein